MNVSYLSVIVSKFSEEFIEITYYYYYSDLYCLSTITVIIYGTRNSRLSQGLIVLHCFVTCIWCTDPGNVSSLNYMLLSYYFLVMEKIVQFEPLPIVTHSPNCYCTTWELDGQFP